MLGVGTLLVVACVVVGGSLYFLQAKGGAVTMPAPAQSSQPVALPPSDPGPVESPEVDVEADSSEEDVEIKQDD